MAKKEKERRKIINIASGRKSKANMKNGIGMKNIFSNNKRPWQRNEAMRASKEAELMVRNEEMMTARKRNGALRMAALNEGKWRWRRNGGVKIAHMASAASAWRGSGGGSPMACMSA